MDNHFIMNMQAHILIEEYLADKKKLLDKLANTLIRLDYPTGKNHEPDLSGNRVVSIGKIKKLKYDDGYYFFIALDLYDEEKDEVYRKYVNIEELSMHVIHGHYQDTETLDAQPLILSKTFKVTKSPKLEYIENSFYYVFDEHQCTYRIQSIELARALFFLNTDLINISFQPNALQHLCSIRENETSHVINFSNLFFARRNFSNYADQQRLAWLLMNKDARASFSSIYSKTEFLGGENFLFNFSPPDLVGKSLTITGYLDKNQNDHFEVKYIEHIDLKHTQTNKDIIFETLNHHGNPTICKINTQKDHHNDFYSDRVYSCFHESIKQLPHFDNKYCEIDIKRMNIPKFYEAEEDYNWRSEKLTLDKSYYFSQLKYGDLYFFIIGLKPKDKCNTKKIVFRIFCVEPCRIKLYYSMIKQFFYYLYQPENFEWKNHCIAFEKIVITRNTDRKIPFTDDEFYAHCADHLHQTIYSLSHVAHFRLLDSDTISDKANELKTRRLNTEYPIICFDQIKLPKQTFGYKKNNKVYILISFGVNTRGEKKLLSFWITRSVKNKFFTMALTELKQRGLSNSILILHNNIESSIAKKISDAFSSQTLQLCFSNLADQISNKKKKDVIEIARLIQEIYLSKNEDDAIKALRKMSKYLPLDIDYKVPINAISELYSYSRLIRSALFDCHKGCYELNTAILKEISIMNTCSSIDALDRAIYIAIQNATLDWSTPVSNWDKKLAELKSIDKNSHL